MPWCNVLYFLKVFKSFSSRVSLHSALNSVVDNAEAVTGQVPGREGQDASGEANSGADSLPQVVTHSLPQVVTHSLPVALSSRFLSLLEEEIYSTSSPIWDPDFKQNPPAHVTAGVMVSTNPTLGCCSRNVILIKLFMFRVLTVYTTVTWRPNLIIIHGVWDLFIILYYECYIL